MLCGVADPPFTFVRLASQALMVSLEKKLSLSEKDNVRLQSRVNILNNELNQTRQAILTSPRSNSVSSPNPNSSNGTYRDTSDFLFNQLKRQGNCMIYVLFIGSPTWCEL